MNEEKFVLDEEESVRTQVLVENTAQGIFNYLKEMYNGREVYQKRWIWELLQNALDAAPEDRKIDITIIRNKNQLRFCHTGRPFKPEEVAHLIYHGSTKKGSDIGKYGTGFLVSHLLSKKVLVAGSRADGKRFYFPLDRTGDSAQDIFGLMNKTWATYLTSLKSNDSKQDYTAEFDYVLDDVSSISAKEGILALIKTVPYILVFNKKIGTIEISEDEHNIKFQLVNESKTDSHIEAVVK